MMENHPFFYPNYYLPFPQCQHPRVISPSAPDSSFRELYEQINKKYNQLKEKHEKLLIDYSQLEKKVNEEKPAKRRRKEAELDRTHFCPYHDCQKTYASDFALNSHIRSKHNGGSKKQRDRTAKIIMKHQEQGQKVPQLKISLPPNYLEENQIRLMLMDSESVSQRVKEEEEQ